MSDVSDPSTDIERVANRTTERHYTTGRLGVGKGGVTAQPMMVAEGKAI